MNIHFYCTAFAFKFRDQMSSSVLDLLDTCTENDVMSTLIKDKDSRDFLDATGKVMLAGLAGAALLTEAIQKSVNKGKDLTLDDTLNCTK